MNNANPVLSEREMKNVNEGARDILRLHVLMCVEIPVAALNIEEFLHFLFLFTYIEFKYFNLFAVIMLL